VRGVGVRRVEVRGAGGQHTRRTSSAVSKLPILFATLSVREATSIPMEAARIRRRRRRKRRFVRW
jgi:hypothetical protein